MRKGFTLVELMLAVLIFTVLFSALLAVLSASDRSWRVSQNKLAEQQAARKTVDKIVNLLRQSSPGWVTISADQGTSTKILFYKPIFNETLRQVNPGPYVIFKLKTDNPAELVKKESDIDANFVTLAQGIESVNFGGGCAGCAAFNCSTVDNGCPVVRIDIKTKKEITFPLVSFVNLRNFNITSSQPEPPPEGEF